MPYIGKTPSQATRARYYLTASGSETSISGSMTTGGTLTFTDGNFVDVSVNGVALVAGTDYNTNTANTIAGLTALTANDQVEIIVYDTFSVFSGDVDSDFSVGGNLSVTGTATLTGAITSSAGATITTADNNPQLTLTSTDTDAGHGPRLNMVRNPSEAGADGDNLGQIFIQGYNDAGTPELIDYFQLFTEIADASDGTEDARQIHYVMTGGSQRSRIEHNATETVINEDSVDVDFRVEGNGNANLLFVDAGNDSVGIGTNTPETFIDHISASIDIGLTIAGSFPGIILNDTDVSGDDGTFGISKAGQSTTINNLGAGDIKFANNGSERFKIDDSGNITVTDGNLIIGTSGHGISFAATSDASGMTSELLGDYEEGTFTPIFQQGLTSAGYSSQEGTYVKIGSLVVCSVFLRANSGTENGDHIYVGGLPFTVITGTGIDHQYGAFFTYNGGFWSSDANTQWLARANETNLAFYKQADGGAIQGSTSGVATNLNADLRLVAVYRST